MSDLDRSAAMTRSIEPVPAERIGARRETGAYQRKRRRQRLWAGEIARRSTIFREVRALAVGEADYARVDFAAMARALTGSARVTPAAAAS